MGLFSLLILSLCAFSADSQFTLFPFLNSDTTRACGQDCLYKKSNDLLTTLALYNESRIRNIQHLQIEAKKLKNSDKKEDQELARSINLAIKEEMREYCESAHIDPESDEDCFYSFSRAIQKEQYQIRQAMIVNSDSYSRLKAGPNQTIPVIISREMAEADQKKKAQTPYLLTAKELQALFPLAAKSLGAKLDELVGLDYEEYLKSQKPSVTQDEFVLLKEVPKDPKNPAGDKILVPDKSCGAEICYDKKAYQLALGRFISTEKTDLLATDYHRTLNNKAFLEKIKKTKKRLPSSMTSIQSSALTEAFEIMKRSIAKDEDTRVRTPANQLTKEVQLIYRPDQFQKDIESLPVSPPAPHSTQPSRDQQLKNHLIDGIE